jgi:hypothetical protein
MSGSSRIPQAPRSFRFSLRTLLTWILAFSVLLAAGRWVYVRTWLQARVVEQLQAYEVTPEYSGLYSPSTSDGPSWHGFPGDNVMFHRVVVGVNLHIPFRSKEDAAEVNRLLSQLPYLVDVNVDSGFRRSQPDRADHELAAAINGLRIQGLSLFLELHGGQTARLIRESRYLKVVGFRGDVAFPLDDLKVALGSTTVQRIRFTATRLTAEQVAVLATADHLRELNIQGQLPYSELPTLGQRPDCELKLTVRDISDNDLIHNVAPLQNLTRLNMHMEAPSDEALAALSRAKRLRTLGLQDALIGDSAVSALADLSALEVLYLAGTDVTESGLTHLARCKSLTQLSIPASLDETRVKAALPGVQVWASETPAHHTKLREQRRAEIQARQATAKGAPLP